LEFRWSEDKADVNARVACSGVGIDLATNAPTPQALREAVRTVLDKPDHRWRASSMASSNPPPFAFTLLLGLLASVPFSGIDMSLPALAATGAALGARPSEVGLTMGIFMFSLAAAPLIHGPASDRCGRKPVVVFGVALFGMASLACQLAQSLPALLMYRLLQGAGAASTTLAMSIVRDLFGGQAARAKIANIVIAINVVTVIAPTAGAALLALGGWRLTHAAQLAVGVVLLFAPLNRVCRERPYRPCPPPDAFSVILKSNISRLVLCFGGRTGRALLCVPGLLPALPLNHF
jgi:MFS family permease